MATSITDFTLNTYYRTAGSTSTPSSSSSRYAMGLYNSQHNVVEIQFTLSEEAKSLTLKFTKGDFGSSGTHYQALVSSSVLTSARTNIGTLKDFDAIGQLNSSYEVTFKINKILSPGTYYLYAWGTTENDYGYKTTTKPTLTYETSYLPSIDHYVWRRQCSSEVPGVPVTSTIGQPYGVNTYIRIGQQTESINYTYVTIYRVTLTKPTKNINFSFTAEGNDSSGPSNITYYVKHSRENDPYLHVAFGDTVSINAQGINGTQTIIPDASAVSSNYTINFSLNGDYEAGHHYFYIYSSAANKASYFATGSTGKIENTISNCYPYRPYEIYYKANDSWNKTQDVYCKINDEWIPVGELFAKQNGIWSKTS